jgi:2-polyprenyl-6-methoxyphenol hydroxylase-like FAD-dependent oxidoreductase
MLRRRPGRTVGAMTEDDNDYDYDVIVCGARCAGSPTAMLLARRGHRVLLVDRATFPSDTVSTHFLHPPGVDALDRWGLLDRLAASGCPAFTTYRFDFGPIVITGSPGTAYGPRRTVLDKLLVDAAAEAGAEVREAFTVDDLLMEDGRVTGIRGHDRGGATVTERARVVVGADGKYSRVAAAVDAPTYNEKPAAEGAYYAYWSGLELDGVEIYIRPDRVLAAIPTHDEQVLVLVAWPAAEFPSFRADVEVNYLKSLDMVPELADRVRAGTRESRFHGSGELPGFFRQPYGPGWALVGDAGYTIDPSTAQGISDAFRDADALSAALEDSLSGRRSYDDAMADFHRERDAAVTPMYELTFELATLGPPPPELVEILGAAAGNQAAMDAFARMFSGVMPIPEFFAPGHVQGIMQAATSG